MIRFSGHQFNALEDSAWTNAADYISAEMNLQRNAETHRQIIEIVGACRKHGITDHEDVVAVTQAALTSPEDWVRSESMPKSDDEKVRVASNRATLTDPISAGLPLSTAGEEGLSLGDLAHGADGLVVFFQGLALLEKDDEGKSKDYKNIGKAFKVGKSGIKLWKVISKNSDPKYLTYTAIEFAVDSSLLGADVLIKNEKTKKAFKAIFHTAHVINDIIKLGDIIFDGDMEGKDKEITEAILGVIGGGFAFASDIVEEESWLKWASFATEGTRVTTSSVFKITDTDGPDGHAPAADTKSIGCIQKCAAAKEGQPKQTAPNECYDVRRSAIRAEESMTRTLIDEYDGQLNSLGPLGTPHWNILKRAIIRAPSDLQALASGRESQYQSRTRRGTAVNNMTVRASQLMTEYYDGLSQDQKDQLAGPCPPFDFRVDMVRAAAEIWDREAEEAEYPYDWQGRLRNRDVWSKPPDKPTSGDADE